VEPGQAAVCLGITCLQDVRAPHGVSVDADVDMRRVVAWHCEATQNTVGRLIHLGPLFELPEVCMRHM
jgi:hypothetical protein